jgi:hypothetical protein
MSESQEKTALDESKDKELHENVEEDDEEEDEENYEEAEPILAYDRMRNDFLDILQKDSVSCIKAGHKVGLKIFKIKSN